MEFKVLETSDLTQTARMTLQPGEASGPRKENEHARSEQVLCLLEGRLRAEIGEESFTMRPGDSVIVRKGIAHRFSNDGREPAVTFNVYSPPAY